MMLDRGDHDEMLPNCPWTQEDAQYCKTHDEVELTPYEDELGYTIYLCDICEKKWRLL